MKKKKAYPKPRRGRSKTDIAQRVRVKLFCYVLKMISGKTNEQLAEALIFDNTKLKMNFTDAGIFGRMEKFGRDPDTPQAIASRGFSLIDAVLNHPEWYPAAEIYLSPLWELITPPKPGLCKVSIILTGILISNGLHRSNVNEKRRGNPSDLAHQCGFNDVYRSSIIKIASVGHFNNLSLIVALYCEALLEGSDQMVAFLGQQLEECLVQCMHAYKLTQQLHYYIYAICNLRLTFDLWFLKNSDFESLFDFEKHNVDCAAFYVDKPFGFKTTWRRDRLNPFPIVSLKNENRSLHLTNDEISRRLGIERPKEGELG